MLGVDALQKQRDRPEPLPLTGGGDLSPAVALRIQVPLQLLYLEVVAIPFCKQGKPAW